VSLAIGRLLVHIFLVHCWCITGASLVRHWCAITPSQWDQVGAWGIFGATSVRHRCATGTILPSASLMRRALYKLLCEQITSWHSSTLYFLFVFKHVTTYIPWLPVTRCHSFIKTLLLLTCSLPEAYLYQASGVPSLLIPIYLPAACYLNRQHFNCRSSDLIYQATHSYSSNPLGI